MKTKTRIALAITILSLSSMLQTFSALLIDINNPYLDIFVFYNSTIKGKINPWGYFTVDLKGDVEDKHAADLYGNYHINHNYERASHNLKGGCPKSLYFEIVIKNGEDRVRLRKHHYDTANGIFCHEEVFKEDFSLNEKKGEITYKVIVKTEIYKDPQWDGSKIDYVLFDFCKVKILYAELDGKEMRLNGNAWEAIQKNCTIKESLKQNCVIRNQNCVETCEDCEKTVREKCPLEKSKKKKKKKVKKFDKVLNKLYDFFIED